MRLAYVSSIPCAPTYGGPLQIHRHFRERSDFEFFDFSDPQTPVWEQWLGRRPARSRPFQRVRNSRIHPWLLTAALTTGLERSARALMTPVQIAKPDAIVTVAFGRMAFVARRLAESLELPLVTVFHDWWPDLVEGLTPRARRWLDREFRLLAKSSTLTFPVCEELARELHSMDNAVLLPPIPAHLTYDSPMIDGGRPREQSPRSLVYTGTLQGNYGLMIRQLGRSLRDDPGHDWQLRAYGPAADWSRADIDEFESAGIYGGVLAQGSELRAALESADALLVVMDFHEAYQRRMRTSFPSKLLDYAPYGKSIIVWGPASCMAMRFVTEHQLGWSICANDARQVWETLADRWNPEGAASCGAACRELAHGTYGSDTIHQIMTTAISGLLSSPHR